MKEQNRDWRQIVEEQAACGKSVQEYCKSIGVHPNTFYRKRKMQRRLVMVEVRPAPSTEISPIIVSVGKYSVAIRTGFDAEALQAVLHVLGELQ